MLTQKPMFDDSGESLARSSDPETSHQSIPEVVTLAAWRHRIDDAARSNRVPMTANELARAVTDNPVHWETARKRVRECERRGLLFVVGKRTCRVTGKPATTFQTTASV